MAIDETLPTDVHMAMVIPALRYQTSPEQREAWLPLATSFRILGAYVQTELGHGSNVRALETTATFDRVGEPSLESGDHALCACFLLAATALLL